VEIVHYSPYLLGPDTGSGNSMRAWCEATAKIGVPVRALHDPTQARRAAPQGVDVEGVEHRFNGRVRIPVRLKEQLQATDVLVVHGGWTLWNIAACREVASTGARYVVTTHGVYNPWVIARGGATKRIWNVLLERRHLRKALALHLFFDAELRGLRALGVDAATVIAPNGVSAPPGIRWDGGSGGYLLWLGRFDIGVKGLDVLVHAIRELPESERPVLRLYGPDAQGGKASLVGLARDLGIERWVQVRDPIHGQEKWEVLARAAAYVHPSRWDTAPMAVGEAVGAGVPTLVADYPLGRLLATEGAAVMCDRTPNAIAGGIARLLSEDGASVGAAGTALATGRLSWDSVARSWLEQVQRLVEG
jgi:glycosyltransferase involved in cell wall biosynthesis